MEYKYVMLAFLLVPMAAATPGLFDEPKGDGIQAAMDNVECRVEFTVEVLESHMEILGADSLQDNIDELEEDVEELQDLADDEDTEGFRAYIHGDFADNMLDARQAALQARNGSNLTYSERIQLRTEHMSAKEDFDTCHYESLKDFADAKIDAYEAIVERLEEREEDLSDKGLDTSGLEELIDDVQEQVVDPLKDSVDEADNATEVREALGNYCMFDGCRDGLNFHMAAKWHIEKLDQILELVEEDAKDAGLEDEWDAAKDYVSEADSALDTVGDGQYEGTEHDDVWDNIEAASDELKDIISELRSG